MAAKLCFLVTALCILFGFANSELHFRTQPQQKTALAGADVTLPCIVEYLEPRHDVLWYRAEVLIAYNTEIRQDPGRISVAADRTIGQFDLHISNVAPSDDMTYKCTVYDTEAHQEVLQSAPIRLEIESTPSAEYPKCIEPPEKTDYLEGEEITMNCTSERANPPVSILWYQGGTQIKNMKPMLDVNGFRTATHTFVVEPSHNGAVFQCKLTTEAIPGYEKSCTIGPLSVVYQPRVSLTSDQVSYQEGDTIQLTCDADANPEPFKYKWSSFFHEESYSFQFLQNDKVVVFPASLEMNGVTMACNATNRYGYSVSNSVTLYVTSKETDVTDPNPSTEGKDSENDINIDFVAKTNQPHSTGLNNWLLLLIIAILSVLIIVLFVVLVLQICRNYQANSSSSAVYSGGSTICNGNNIDYRAWDQTSVYFEPQDQISVVYDPAWTRQNSQCYQAGQRNIGVQVPFHEEPHYAEIELDWDEEHGTLEL